MGAQPIQVLLVEKNAEEARRLHRLLRAGDSGRNLRLRRVRCLQDARQVLQKGRIGVVLFDLCSSAAKALEFVRQAQQVAPEVPLVLLSNAPDDALAADALREGAQDFLLKRELADGRLVRALSYAMARQRARASLHLLSLNDDLTGLHNRRGFVTLAEQHLKLTRRRGLRSSLVFVDLDDLKCINDNFGHLEGDYALQQVARVLRECFRESDIVARLGGDEFCALLSDATETSEDAVRSRLQHLLDAHNRAAQRPYRLSVSVGIVEVAGAVGLEQHIARADSLMYVQKRTKHGRALIAASTA